MDMGPEIETHHHHHTGRQWVDVILGVSVVVISIISLLLAMENGTAMKRLVAANSWPFVMTGVSNGDEAGNRFLQLLMENKGVGPAKILSLEVFYKGRAMANPKALIHAILGPEADGVRVPLITSSVVGGVLSSKERSNFLTVKDQSIPPAMLEKLADGTDAIRFRTCYCSVFDECWMLDSTGKDIQPAPVKTCPIPKVPFDD